MAVLRLYHWSGLDPDNQILTGVLPAGSAQAAGALLIQQNVTPVSLTARRRLICGRAEKQYLLHFTRQLATLLTSGLPLLKALALLHNECRFVFWQWLIHSLQTELKQGKTLSQALAAWPGVFTAFYQRMITTGEETGKLPVCLEGIAAHLEERQQQYKLLISAIRYPAILFITSILMMILMLVFVLPEFAQIYRSFNAELPVITQQLIYLSEIFAHHLFTFVTGFLCLLFFYLTVRKRYSPVKHYEAHYLLRLPFAGKLIINTLTARLFETLALTQQSGIPLLKGIDTLIVTTGHPVAERTLIQLRTALLKGNTFSKAIRESGFFPGLCHELIATAEETGQFDHFFRHIADWYKTRTLNQINHFFKILQPALFIFLAIMVTILLIAMYLPLLRLGDILV